MQTPRIYRLRTCSLALAVWGAFGSSCTSYQSVPYGSAPLGSGLVYYLPKRPIIIQIAVTTDADTKERIETPSLPPALAVPDTTKPFVLSDGTNFIAEDNIGLGVSAQGLLQSANSTVTSQADTILQNIATAAGAASVARTMPGPIARPMPSDNCKPGNTYSVFVWPGENKPIPPICGFTAEVTPIFNEAQLPQNHQYASQTDNSSGIFYRLELPYQVNLTPATNGVGASVSFLAFSPDQSPTYFLGIKRVLFAKNTANITLVDGELKNFSQDDTGELVGLTQIPADVISAYFSAVSKIVPQETTSNNDRAALAVSTAQRQMCLAAISANPIAGKSVADQTTAFNNIKTACASAPTPSTAQ